MLKDVINTTIFVFKIFVFKNFVLKELRVGKNFVLKKKLCVERFFVLKYAKLHMKQKLMNYIEHGREGASFCTSKEATQPSGPKSTGIHSHKSKGDGLHP